jgi:site-specific recombinase XerD
LRIRNPARKTIYMVSVKKKGELCKMYWELKKQISNADNQKVINEFLLSTIRTKSIAIRSFYHYCVEKGYIEETPIKSQKKVMGKYWEVQIQLPNRENLRVINEYLLSMKVANQSFYTINNIRYFLQIFFKEQESTFSSLTSNEIIEWLTRYDIGAKENTLKFHLSVLSTFFSFCIEEGYLEKSPIKLRWFPRCARPVPKYLVKEEIAKIHLHLEKNLMRDRGIIEFFLSSGCRVGELYRLNQSHIDLHNRTAQVIGKGNKIRHVHFSEKCAFILERYLISRKDSHPALFVSTGVISSRLTREWIGKIVSRIGKEAGMRGSLHPHRFRHTFATNLLVKGADLLFIADELGHNDLKTTLVYANLPNTKVISLYRKYIG